MNMRRLTYGVIWCALTSLVTAHGDATITTSPKVTAAPTPSIRALSKCHMHGHVQHCMFGSSEYAIRPSHTAHQPLPTAYSDCHAHGSETYCEAPNGDEVRIEASSGKKEHHHDHHHHASSTSAASEKHCHFHAGVEHCTEAGEEEHSHDCGRVVRDYKIPLRAGLLFIILATSAIGVFAPLVLRRMTRLSPTNWLIVVLKQFGSGVIIATAFIHLYGHAQLILQNKCLGELKYEGTTSAIAMAGLFISFVIDLVAGFFITSQSHKSEGDTISTSGSSAATNLFVLETGIVFHSIMIGLTMVVAPDPAFMTLFAVIMFHQMFEGIALGTRIAAAMGNTTNGSRLESNSPASSATLPEKSQPISWKKAIILGFIFAVITPVGMAIGIGVLHIFNGNDPSTIIAIGTVTAFSAGILIWVGVVEMLAHDWIGPNTEMGRESVAKKVIGMTSMVVGMAIMSVLGKWA